MYSNFDNVRVSKHSAFEWILNYGGKCMCICSYYTHFRPYYHSVDSTIKTVLYIFLHWYLYGKRDVCIHFVALLLHTKKQSVWKCELFFMFSLLMFFVFFAVSDVFKSMLFGNSGLMFFLSNSQVTHHTVINETSFDLCWLVITTISSACRVESRFCEYLAHIDI